jgi:hypothetical protein
VSRADFHSTTFGDAAIVSVPQHAKGRAREPRVTDDDINGDTRQQIREPALSRKRLHESRALNRRHGMCDNTARQVDAPVASTLRTRLEASAASLVTNMPTVAAHNALRPSEDIAWPTITAEDQMPMQSGPQPQAALHSLNMAKVCINIWDADA